MIIVIIIIVLINKIIKGNNNKKNKFLFSKMDYHLQLIMLKIINLINVYNYLNHNKSFNVTLSTKMNVRVEFD